jgi:hypothetical protein
MERLANLSMAHTKKYPALIGCEIIALARADRDAAGKEHSGR